MVSIRKWLVVALGAALTHGAVSSGCGTEPVAPEACRKIETARCNQATKCPGLNVPDAQACIRFYRDQCLHGLAIESNPGDPAVDRCVKAIDAVGACISAGTPADKCVATSRAPTSLCEVIERPEIASDCAFLIPPAPAPAAAAGASGAAGTTGAAGEAASAGAAGAGGSG